MPKVSHQIPDDFLLKNLDNLSGNIQITPQQVAMILGIGVASLKEYRMRGAPPRFVKEGGSIRYRVGDVREYLNQKSVFNNTAQAAVARMRRHLG